MKELGRKLLFLLLLFILVMVSIVNIKKPYEEDEKKQIMVEVSRQDGRVQTIDLETYIVGVVSAEMPASFEMEALKAQAVACRTFVMSRGLKVDDTTSSQVYHDQKQRQEKWQDQYEVYEQKIESCVNQTAGEVLMYDGKYISALFFSSSNGKTENNDDYFASASLPYLQSVDSSWDLAYAATFREKTFTEAQLNELFNTDHFWINILSYTQSGRVENVEVCGQSYTGREIREKLGLASSDFEISVVGDEYTFKTIGYGHGVGMSQYGANGMAKEGYLYKEILNHYYQGATLEKIN